VASSEALEFATVYDIDKWEGSMKTLQRIRDPFDMFCKMIDDQFVGKWARETSI
jgi:chromosome partitioning protein